MSEARSKELADAIEKYGRQIEAVAATLVRKYGGRPEDHLGAVVLVLAEYLAKDDGSGHFGSYFFRVGVDQAYSRWLCRDSELGQQRRRSSQRGLEATEQLGAEVVGKVLACRPDSRGPYLRAADALGGSFWDVVCAGLTERERASVLRYHRDRGGRKAANGTADRSTNRDRQYRHRAMQKVRKNLREHPAFEELLP